MTDIVGIIDVVGIIGVGHLASYLVEGLRRASAEIEIVLSPRNVRRSANLAVRFGATVAADNQAVVGTADLVLLTTRPADAIPACEAITFEPDHVLVSTAAGLSLAALRPVVEPATAARAMPISCAALNQSPTLLYPDHPRAHALFDLLGHVHVLAEESLFTPASVIAAFYGWVYALFDETVAWTERAGIPPETARHLVLETAQGAAAMGLAHPEIDLATMLDWLATPGGITEHGLQVLAERDGLSAWVEALDVVYRRMREEA